MGPHITASELESTLKSVSIGKEEGATLETGGERPSDDEYGDGLYLEPAVFSNVDSDTRIAQEEIFGPVLPISRVGNFEEVLAVANDVEYGLSTSIVTQVLTQANQFVDSVESGIVKISEKTTGLELHIPFGGFKDSSTNTYREQRNAGIDFFTSIDRL